MVDTWNPHIFAKPLHIWTKFNVSVDTESLGWTPLWNNWWVRCLEHQNSAWFPDSIDSWKVMMWWPSTTTLLPPSPKMSKTQLIIMFIFQHRQSLTIMLHYHTQIPINVKNLVNSSQNNLSLTLETLIWENSFQMVRPLQWQLTPLSDL